MNEWEGFKFFLVVSFVNLDCSITVPFGKPILLFRDYFLNSIFKELRVFQINIKPLYMVDKFNLLQS